MNSLALAIILFLDATSAWASSPRNQEFARRLTELRAKVEEKHDELNRIKNKSAGERTAITTSIADLEALLARERVTLNTLTQDVKKLETELERTGDRYGAINQNLITALNKLQIYAEKHIPFKLTQRLKAISEAKLETESMVTHNWGSVWGLLEDELRLRTENRYDRQEVEIDGKKLLADVVIIGGTSMIWKAGERVGSWENGSAMEFEDSRHIHLAQSTFENFATGGRNGAALVHIYNGEIRR